MSERAKALRKVSDRDLFADVVPLQVMLRNMRFHFNKAEALATDVIGRIERLPRDTSAEDLRVILSDYAKMLSYREQAQVCAVDAAPYCHPRLSAIHVSGSVGHRQELPDGVTPQEALEHFRANLKTRKQPQQIDHVPAEVGGSE